MGDADAVMLEMLKGLRQDVVTIRDNHLAHIAEDIDKIQQEQILARKDIDELKTFKEGIEEYIKTGINKILVGVGAIVTASIGIPMAL
ncbi:MAG: hypothetical protein CMF52_02815 [Legionellales bacterium]|nr:hypothetical protein [Legionellales bacterium]